MEEQFGNRLMNLRKVNGLSQEDLGNLVGVSRQTVSKWESNQTTPEMDKLVSISDVFHISLDELLGREKNVHENANYDELNRKIDTIINSKKPFHYEYKSNITVGKLPLVHVNLGYGMYRAKGIISIGMISTGIISLGLLSCGIISIGVLALGVFALAAMAAGIIAAGSISLGILALGAISIGYLSVGALAIGVYSIGADAIAIRIAFGDVASGHIAIGKTTAKGSVEFLTKNHVSADEIKSAILREYPNTWGWIVKMFSSQGK
jgi:transcriptional regulator with XRE-family HTH domain